jgi:hypothetical protein
MLNHITLLQFTDQTTDSDIDELEKDLDGLPNFIVEIQMLEFGRNVIHAANSYDFAVLALFANQEALHRYLQHPEQRIVMEKIERMSQRIITVDFYGSDAGSLQEKPPENWLVEDEF